jgi:hypothetical protein
MKLLEWMAAHEACNPEGIVVKDPQLDDASFVLDGVWIEVSCSDCEAWTRELMTITEAEQLSAEARKEGKAVLLARKQRAIRKN